MEILEAERARRERGGSRRRPRRRPAAHPRRRVGRASTAATRACAGAQTADDRAALARRPRGARSPTRRSRTSRRSTPTSSTRRSSALRDFERELSELRHAAARCDRRARARDRGPAGRRDRGMKPESLDSLETRLHDLGDFIRDQRRNARLSLRKLSELGRHLESVPQPDRARPAQAVGRDPAGDRQGPAHLGRDALRAGRHPRRAGRRRPGRGRRRARRPDAQRAPEAGAGRDLPVVPGRDDRDDAEAG